MADGPHGYVSGPELGLSDGLHEVIGEGGYRQLPRNHGGEFTSMTGDNDWSWKPNRRFIERKPAPEKTGKDWDYYINLE